MLDALRNWAGHIDVARYREKYREGAGESGTAGLADADIDRMKAAQVDLLYQMDRGSGSRPIIAFLIATWLIADRGNPLAWSALAIYCAAWMAFNVLQIAYDADKARGEHPEIWAQRFCLASFFTGIAWGFGGVIWFAVDALQSQSLALLVIIGIATASIIPRSPHNPSLLAFLVASTLPVILSLIIAGTGVGIAMGVLGVVLISSLYQWSSILRSWQQDAIALQFKNNTLVDELKDRSRAAEEGRRAAEAGERSKSEFLATMSHEVRTPLNGILGTAQLLQMSKLDRDQREHIDVIVDSGELLSAILNDILDLSKLDAGRLEIQVDAVDALEAAEAAVKLFASNAGAKGIELEIRADTTTPVAVSADLHRVRQVLMNLIGNALKFTEEGEVVVSFGAPGSPALPDDLRPDVGADRVIYAVTDTGIGIPEAAQKNVFEPFRQADQTTTRHYGGSGLGLTICTRLVEMMGGEIGLISTPGKGSTFWFALPAADPAECSTRDRTDGHGDIPQQAPRRILLVEDNQLNAKVAETLLSRDGHDVIWVTDGQEAVQHMEKTASDPARRPDLLLMDLRMPRMNGREAARRIRAMDGPAAQLPIIALTADIAAGEALAPSSDAWPEEFQGIFDGILAKPLAPRRLNAAIFEHTNVSLRLGQIAADDERYDAAHLTDLRDSLGVEVFAELIDAFSSDLDRIATEIAAAAQNGKHDNLGLHAHDLAGAAANLGFIALSRSARELKAAARAQKKEGVAPQVDALNSALAQVRDVLQKGGL